MTILRGFDLGIDNAEELADRIFGGVGMRKFVRTHHLLDLGSATRDDLGK